VIGVEIFITILLWSAALMVGIMAGVYFAFSVFVMQSLDVVERSSGMIAMQSINRVIQKSLFVLIFFTSSLACLTLAILGGMAWSDAGAWQMAFGGGLYIIGMLVVTIVGNVPLNNALEGTDAHGGDAETMWRRYMSRWLPWNHVRTISSGLVDQRDCGEIEPL
jgi:uncharacterized membrane protein